MKYVSGKSPSKKYQIAQFKTLKLFPSGENRLQIMNLYISLSICRLGSDQMPTHGVSPATI